MRRPAAPLPEPPRPCDCPWRLPLRLPAPPAPLPEPLRSLCPGPCALPLSMRLPLAPAHRASLECPARDPKMSKRL